MSREEISDAIRTLSSEWNDRWGYTAKQINNGECMEFVNDFFIQFDIDSVERMTTNDLPETYVAHEDGFDAEPYHMWITDGEYHYDPEIPNGVDSWKDLPFFQRTLGI